jgi:hypothetical protein
LQRKIRKRIIQVVKLPIYVPNSIFVQDLKVLKFEARKNIENKILIVVRERSRQRHHAMAVEKEREKKILKL